ncbi:MAG: hypothetical protein PUC54_02005 [Clostridiales bacterium]|nr:hypothetical protein [Clostridiales bacterium]
MNELTIDWNRIVKSKEQLQGVMIEALYKQGLLTEEQRRNLRQILRCDILDNSERS